MSPNNSVQMSNIAYFSMTEIFTFNYYYNCFELLNWRQHTYFKSIQVFNTHQKVMKTHRGSPEHELQGPARSGNPPCRWCKRNFWSDSEPFLDVFSSKLEGKWSLPLAACRLPRWLYLQTADTPTNTPYLPRLLACLPRAKKPLKPLNRCSFKLHYIAQMHVTLHYKTKQWKKLPTLFDVL